MSAFEDAVIQRIKQLEREVERLQRWEQPVGKWQSHTVSWTAATTNPAIGNGTLVGRYIVIGKLCTYVLGLVMALLPHMVLATGHFHYQLTQ